MIDTFDSRGLHFTDCYGQRFMRPGAFRYHVLPAGTHCMVDDRPYSIEVVARAGGGKFTQHDVTLRNTDASFEPDRATLNIEVGDLVLWHCPQQTAPPFEVRGEEEFFGSARLVNECGYSHAFGAAGEYPWVDARGGEIGGVVRVHDPGCENDADLHKWRRRLSEGALVMITGTKVEPEQVDIVTGQTVFFAVVKGPGITITDRRLVREARLVDEEKRRARQSAAGR